jgi:hypothetical protein
MILIEEPLVSDGTAEGVISPVSQCRGESTESRGIKE